MQSLPSNTQIPSSTAFAQNGNRSTIVASSDRDMNWSSGFPEIFSRLLRDGGKYVKREDMNAILYALSNEALYRQWGGVVSYNAAVANQIFGYPVGATLIYKDPQTGTISFVESQVANNQIPPSSATIDTKTDINGQYADNGVVRWKTVLSNEGQSVPYINVPILTPLWFDHKVTNLDEWILSVNDYTADNQYGWITQGVAPKVFEHLKGEISSATTITTTVAGIEITYKESTDGHKIIVADGQAWDGTSYQKYENAVDYIFDATGVAWYYVLDSTNGCFRLPRTKFQSFSLGDTIPVVGNGLALGMTNGTVNFGLGGHGAGYNSGIGGTDNYGAPVGRAIGGRVGFDVGVGVTSDSTKSGLVGKLKSETDANFYLYFCAAEYVSSSGGSTGGGVIDGTLLEREENQDYSGIWAGYLSTTATLVYTVRHDCGLAIIEARADQYRNTGYYLDKDCKQPIWKHAESWSSDPESWGTIVPLKAGCTIYARLEDNQSYPKTIYFYEYALYSIAPQIAMPDYNSQEVQEISSATFDATEDGWILCNPNVFLVNIYVNGVLASRAQAQVAGGNFSWSGTIVPVSAGDKVTFSSVDGLKFIPCKTVQQSAPPAYITRYGRDASTGFWYRVYSDGFCEQGGTMTASGTVTLPLHYDMTVASYQVTTSNGATISSKANTGFSIDKAGDWHTMGYIR